MNTCEQIAEKVRDLPPDQQKEVLDFVEFLTTRVRSSKASLRSPYGLWAGLGVDVTEEDIAAARREMWGNFPREDI